MPLSLDDPRWNELRGSYGGTSDIVAWLGEIQRPGSFSDKRLGDLINEVQHQGDTTTAMYAVAAHLIALARQVEADQSLLLFSHAGLIYADSARPGATPCPLFLREEFDALAPEGARLLAPLIPTVKEFDSFKYAVAALAGFAGQHAFGRLLVGIDCCNGVFSHSSLDDPFPAETP